MRVAIARSTAALASATAAAVATCSGVPASGRKVSASDAFVAPARVDGPSAAAATGAEPSGEVPGICTCGEASQRAFDQTADEYDDLVGREELFMGLRLLRWWLLRRASGDVLEVACGTARNLSYYGRAVASLTLMDSSEGMLAQARRKARERLGRGGGHLSQITTVRGSAEALRQSDASFDCVVDTFGLCSMDDPVGALLEMQRVCRPGGTILLLEHGSGTWGFVNDILDRSAGRHFEKWGCWYNRDLDSIVTAAGLRVKRRSRWHFGTTYVYECSPAEPEALRAAREAHRGRV